MILRRLQHGLVWLSLGVAVASTCYSLAGQWRLASDNESIAQLLAGEDVSLGSVITGKPELRLARAYYLKQKQRYDDALAVLDVILDKGKADLKVKVRFNLGNLYLEQAVQHVENGNMHHAVPLVTLAKQAYRQALALDSQFWDAKYNLEVAMRLLPEMERLNLEGPQEPDNAKTELWTTIPGMPRGLP